MGITLTSVVVALAQAATSVVGLMLGMAGLYGNPVMALGPLPSTTGVLVPGLLGYDAFNLVVAVPLLVGTVWAANRGNLVAQLLWPGVLYYALYTYAIYLIGAPFSLLFLLYALLVALSVFTTIALMITIASERVRERLAPAVPVRLVGGLLAVLALATIVQDASGDQYRGRCWRANSGAGAAGVGGGPDD
jgi:hypothetical protein